MGGILVFIGLTMGHLVGSKSGAAATGGRRMGSVVGAVLVMVRYMVGLLDRVLGMHLVEVG